VSWFGSADVDDEEWAMGFVGADARNICLSVSSPSKSPIHIDREM
jgi:hypothetical protein